MPTKIFCERCHAPLDQSMNWCNRCFLDAPWAPPSRETKPADASDWPDIWDGDAADRELFQPFEDRNAAAFDDSRSRGWFTSWSRPTALLAVALLAALATLSALFVPVRLVGFVSMLSLSTIALLVVRRTWRSQPGRG